ncbi:MAG TPA: divalent-cation tolerance protein CutA [Lentisphaeria bacterium]|nr:MAG: hypothetical protein A2X47_09830 [Lentisphaerae bacterium GWF2_38_69]HBM16634.1 divalent-cation tolerance protein CutA [Lentisphaeria bacterium]
MKIYDYCVVVTTVDSMEKAEKLASVIIEAKLGACVQISRTTSFYFWDDKVNNDLECKLEIKTKSCLYEKLEELIIKNHSYQTPEIIQIPLMNGSTAYLNWIQENCQ